MTIHGGSELRLKHYYSNGGQLDAIKSVRGYQTEIYWQGQKKIETTAKGVLVGTGVTIETNGQATYTGIVTATLFSGASQIGIQSAGTQIGAGITQLNFVGTGNTFAVNGTTVDTVSYTHLTLPTNDQV